MKEFLSSLPGKVKSFLSAVASKVKPILSSLLGKAKPFLSSLLSKVKPFLSSKLGKLMVLIAILLLLLILGFTRCSGKQEVPVETRIGIVSVDNLDIHKKPKETSRVTGHLPLDLEVEILEEKDVDEIVWGRIDKMQLPDGSQVKAGWIDLQYVGSPGDPDSDIDTPDETTGSETVTVTADMGTVTASKLNIRKGPDSKYETDGAYYKGDRIEILETATADDTVWGRTNLGWVGMGYVRMDGTAGLDPDNPLAEEIVTNENAAVLGYGVVDLKELNVRLGPGTEYEKIGTVNQGVRYAYYQVSSAYGDWVRIEDGWVSTEYFYLEGTAADDAMTGTVTTDDLNIRSGPGTSFRSTGTYQQGDTIEILAQVGTWGYTELGWVSMSYVEPKEPTYTTGTCTVSRGLNIRQEPNADSEIVGTLVEGNVVTVLEVEGGWGKIVQGWINLKYVEYQ